MNADEWRLREALEGTALTEEAWLACPAPDSLLYRALRLGASERKLRLVGCACCRLVWHNLIHPQSKAAVEAAERFADGACSVEELSEAGEEAVAVAWPGTQPRRGDRDRRAEYVEHVSAAAAAAVTGVEAEDGWPFWEHLGDVLERAVEAADSQPFGLSRAAMEAALCDSIRDVLGNPFRPVTVARAWLTPNVTSIAQAAYDERLPPSGDLDPARLAVLADALEEAGCADQFILAHCRGPGPHVRGCWVVDLVLGKS
jgi:hypothetical protein